MLRRTRSAGVPRAAPSRITELPRNHPQTHVILHHGDEALRTHCIGASDHPAPRILAALPMLSGMPRPCRDGVTRRDGDGRSDGDARRTTTVAHPCTA